MKASTPPVAGIHALVYDMKAHAWRCNRPHCTFACTHWDINKREVWEPRDLKCPRKEEM
jgi:hypothetical protein